MPKGKRPTPPPLRPLSPDTVTWAQTGLSSDSPYRRIGDTYYPTMYRAYIEEVIRLPAALTLTPIDMMFLVALGGQLDLNSDATAARFRTDPAWKYALHVPLDFLAAQMMTSGDLFSARKTLVSRVFPSA